VAADLTNKLSPTAQVTSYFFGPQSGHEMLCDRVRCDADDVGVLRRSFGKTTSRRHLEPSLGFARRTLIQIDFVLAQTQPFAR
jgi:hypothetical protein